MCLEPVIFFKELKTFIKNKGECPKLQKIKKNMEMSKLVDAFLYGYDI